MREWEALRITVVVSCVGVVATRVVTVADFGVGLDIVGGTS